MNIAKFLRTAFFIEHLKRVLTVKFSELENTCEIHIIGLDGEYKSSRPEVFCKNGVLKNFAKFIGKHDWKTCNFIKKRLQHRCFPVNFAKFLRTLFFIEHLWWVLLGVGLHVLENLSELSSFCRHMSRGIGTTNILGKYRIFNAYNKKFRARKFSKVFLIPYNARWITNYFVGHSVEIIWGRRHILKNCGERFS